MKMSGALLCVGGEDVLTIPIALCNNHRYLAQNQIGVNA